MEDTNQSVCSQDSAGVLAAPTVRDDWTVRIAVEFSSYLDCLSAGYGRLRAVAPIDLGAAVPTCPGWSVADLTRHVGRVYLHKTQAMREGAEPTTWPPKELADIEPLALLDQGYTQLRAEFAARNARDPCGTWYAPDQTVGFWIRRMAQETVIHRIDAELGTHQPVALVPTDLALDGIDELLKVFVAYSVSRWGDSFNDILATSPGRTYALRTYGAAWRVRTGPGKFVVQAAEVEDATRTDRADVTVSGSPTAVLRWVWNRDAEDDADCVSVEGSAEAVAELKRCIVTGTQ